MQFMHGPDGARAGSQKAVMRWPVLKTQAHRAYACIQCTWGSHTHNSQVLHVQECIQQAVVRKGLTAITNTCGCVLER